MINALKDILQRCHQRHNNPLRQRKTRVTPALYKGLRNHFTVYCAWRYPVRFYELEQADISFMPIGQAPHSDQGPKDFAGERFLKRQRLNDWDKWLLCRSWGIQIYTGAPSGQDGAQWHDIDFKYDAICAAPDTVLACIEALINSVANPLLTLTNSGGLRFSCRVQNYLHPNTNAAKQYVYKHTPTADDPQHRDVYLEILGKAGYSCWDARYEILRGNLLDPPIITEAVLFAPIDTLRTALHQPAPPRHEALEPMMPVVAVAPVFLDSRNFNLAKEAFLKRGFSYVQEEDGVYYWHLPNSSVDDGHILLWEQEGSVWVRASAPNAELPMEAAQITDIWDDTGILPRLPPTGLPVSDKILAIREGTLSPLAVKRPHPTLHKPETSDETLEKRPVQTRDIFDSDARILTLVTETGTAMDAHIETYLRDGGRVCLNVADGRTTREVVVQWKPRMYGWEKVEDIPIDARMKNPFQHGNVCEDAKRCDALEKKGGDPSESICPKCPVYMECQERGYLSQPATLKSAKVQIAHSVKLFLNPNRSEIVEGMLGQVDDTERLCIVDAAEAFRLFPSCRISKNTLEAWRVNWNGSALGNFANALLNALEVESEPDVNAVGRIGAVVRAFEREKEVLIEQMCQVNVPGKVVPREFVDEETGRTLARFSIAFENGVAAYIPLDTDAMRSLTTKGLSVFQLNTFEPNANTKIAMSMTQAIKLGILDTATVENIETFPSVYRYSHWTLWHQLKRFSEHYLRDADAPMLWTGNEMRFWVPPVLHPKVKRLLFISSRLSEQDLHRAFPGEDIEVHHIKPTAWVAGNQVFQIRTGIYPRETLLNYDTDWHVLGMSETGQRFFLGIQAEIEKDPSVKHAILTTVPVTRHLQNIAARENVCFVTGFKKIDALEDAAFEAAEVVWIVGTPYWSPGITWRRSQVVFGNDEKPLCYEGDAEYGNFKDERIQRIYDQDSTKLLTQIVERAGLNRLPNKTVVLLSSMPLPNITDRPEVLLFDWEDFEVAGGLDKLSEVIAERQRFETERDNLTAASGRKKVEQVLGISSSQANRILMKLRGGKLLRAPFRDQILSCLADGEKKSKELIEAIEGNPGSIRNALKRLIDAGEIVRVRRSVYALSPKK